MSSNVNSPSSIPLLPKINSKIILNQIFTHRSLLRRPKRAFEDPPHDPKRDNEQLVNLGDQVFGLVVTNLIRDSFPYLSVGPSSKVRDRLKYHGTLAKTAVLYGLHERLLVQAAQANEVKRSVHAQAEVFKVELIPLQRVDEVSLKTFAQAYVGGLYREQGLDIVSDWLRPLFQVDIREAYENERKEYLLPPA
ncbi:ribonuclease III domain-containing protein [Russula dissimulans]|nr:ribonuclease III domain-containing protein [Russula dissimulans]